MRLEQRYHRLDALEEVARERLLRDVYAVDATLFHVAHLSYEAWLEDFLMPGAWRTVMWTLEDAHRGVVSYHVINVFRVERAGREHLVVRSTIGALPDYRGKARTMWASIKIVVPLRFRHPRARLSLLDLIVHPSAYHVLEQQPWDVYPRPETPCLPDDIADFVRAAGVALHIPAAALDGPVPTTVAPRDEGDRARWANHPRRGPRYFIERNPNYDTGDALLVYIPLGFGNIWRTIVRGVSMQVRRSLDNAIGGADRRVRAALSDRRHIAAPNAQRLPERKDA